MSWYWSVQPSVGQVMHKLRMKRYLFIASNFKTTNLLISGPCDNMPKTDTEWVPDPGNGDLLVKSYLHESSNQNLSRE